MARRMIVLVVTIFALLSFTCFHAHHVWNQLPPGTTIDRILVEKSDRKLSVFANGKKLKSDRVALRRNAIGAKQEEGDDKTPQGVYKIDGPNAQSNFHLALHISFPSDEDKQGAAEHGVSAAFDMMIHGIRNGLGWIGAFHRLHDWTAGCIALTDEEIEELWRITPKGATVEIRH
jgi:murein L,D-transpeptidase YafK